MLGRFGYPEFTVFSHPSSPSWCNHKIDIALKSSSMPQARAIPRTTEWQWQLQVPLGHLQNAPLQGIAAGMLWDSKACCDFMYSWEWYFWLTPEMVQFFLLFQSVLWQTEMTSSFVVTNSRSQCFPSTVASFWIAYWRILGWPVCSVLLKYPPVCFTLGEVFLENNGYC